MSIIKKLLVAIIVLSIVVMPINAQTSRRGSDDNGNSSKFKDISEDYWAYSDIIEMVNRGIINGYSDNSFKPDGTVSRSEFAKIMVLALDLKILSPKTSTFQDVDKNSWAITFIETAKPYLTGFRSNGVDYFKPSLPSVREDMAVALVKALNKPLVTDLTILDQFKDKDTISTNLKYYVATAVKEGIMLGDTNGNFGAQANLTRAQAAALLLRIANEEKVTYTNEDKVTYEAAVTTPVLAATGNDQGVQLNWNEVGNIGFKYYKVTISKTDSTPSYPENGYVVAISNPKEISYLLKAGAKYGEKTVAAGDELYVAITAVYDNNKYFTSNVKKVTIPAAPVVVAPTTKIDLSYQIVDNKLKLSWTKSNNEGFNYYKVVVSKNDNTPRYPENGYLVYFTDVNNLSYTLDTNTSYNNYDNSNNLSGKLESGEDYYISITAVHSNGSLYSNTISIKMP